MTTENDPHVFSHPEAREAFSALVSTVIDESDRGAVLIGACLVDEYLDRLLKAVSPADFGFSRYQRLLNGPLKSTFAKVEVAVLCRLIPASLGRSIHHLRDLRNELAHSIKTFKLRDHWDLIRQVFDLGPGVPVGINRIALELLLSDAVRRLLALEKPMEDAPGLAFDSPGAVMDYLAEHSALLEPIEQRVPRMELAIGIAMICALIVIHRDKVLRRSGPSSTNEPSGGFLG